MSTQPSSINHSLTQPGLTPCPDPDIRFLRATAVLLIFACHVLEAYGNFLAWWLNAGVQLFLLISGYVFGARTVRDWPAWLARRLARILPPYYLLVLAVILANLLIIAPRDLAAPFLATLLGVQDFFKICLPGCDHLWFITLILVCYLTVPALQALRARARSPLATASVCLIFLPAAFYLVYKIFPFLTFAYVFNLCAFAWGYFLGTQHHQSSPQSLSLPSPQLSPHPLSRAAVPLVLVAALALVIVRAAVESLHLAAIVPWSTLYDKLLLPGSRVGLALAFFALLRGHVRRLASTRAVRLVDDFSYEIYLTHHVFMFGPFALAPRVHSVPLAITLMLALTAVATWALRSCVEAFRPRAAIPSPGSGTTSALPSAGKPS